MDIVNGLLLPVGFKELIEYLDSQHSKVVQAKDIQKGLAKQYKFSSGKVAGTIKRAEEKGLLSRVGYGAYQYNSEKTKEYHLPPLSQKSAAESKTVSSTMTSTKPREQNFLTKINDEIMQAVKRIKEIPYSEMSVLSGDDFQKAQDKISALEKLAKQ